MAQGALHGHLAEEVGGHGAQACGVDVGGGQLVGKLLEHGQHCGNLLGGGTVGQIRHGSVLGVVGILGQADLVQRLRDSFLWVQSSWLGESFPLLQSR